MGKLECENSFFADPAKIEYSHSEGRNGEKIKKKRRGI